MRECEVTCDWRPRISGRAAHSKQRQQKSSPTPRRIQPGARGSLPCARDSVTEPAPGGHRSAARLACRSRRTGCVAPSITCGTASRATGCRGRNSGSRTRSGRRVAHGEGTQQQRGGGHTNCRRWIFSYIRWSGSLTTGCVRATPAATTGTLQRARKTESGAWRTPCTHRRVSSAARCGRTCQAVPNRHQATEAPRALRQSAKSDHVVLE